MPEVNQTKAREFELRAKLPKIVRMAALTALAITILLILVGFYRERNKSQFRLKSEHTQLSTDVVARVNGYERLETDGEKPKYYIKADTATTFSDNHQELDNVFIQTYDDAGAAADKMTADKTLYVPEENKNFTAYMKGNVDITTRDALHVKTNNIVYTKKDDTVDADEAIEFERENIRGRAFGALVKVAEKRIELLKDVEIETLGSADAQGNQIKQASLKSGWASYDQAANRVDLKDNVQINTDSGADKGKARSTVATADQASAFLLKGESGSFELQKAEMTGNVYIQSTEEGGGLTKINSGFAMYDRTADRFELRNGAKIITDSQGKPTEIAASEAVYERAAGKVTLNGGAEITQGINYVKGDVINAELNGQNHLKNSFVRGNAYMKQTSPERMLQVSANELSSFFDDSQQLRSANASGQSAAELVPANADEYTKVRMTTPGAIKVAFQGGGLLQQMRTDGRTTIQLDVPNKAPDSANKRLTADNVTTFFNDDGKNLKKAEAVGNAELFVEPLNASSENYRTMVNAPRFDCEFFPTGNNAKDCVGGKNTKTVRVPTVGSSGRGEQTLVAEQLTAVFNAGSNNVERLDATGSTKFVELDRSAVAATMSFTQGDRTVRLRGGEPTAWDSKSRAKAKEIDWDTANQKSFMRGSVSTTYYSRKQGADAAPFGDSDKPVFITAETAEFDHRGETATYSGNARGWQENNYVRAAQITIKQREGQFVAVGGVQSVLYNVKQKRKGADSNVPVYASSDSMTYARDSRILHYQDKVDIRQGTDRMISNSADVYLNDKNELTKTIAESGVVLTQPNRRATGEWVQYTADDEVAILRGNPAQVSDAENGALQGGQLTVNLRDHRVVGEGKTSQNSGGRLRSVYKVKNNH